MPPVRGRGRRGGGDLPARHRLRRRQDPRAHRPGPRGARREGGVERRGVRRPLPAPFGAGPHRGLRRRERRPGQRPEDGRRGAGLYALGRARLLPRGPGGLRAGPRERREPHRPRRGDPARAVRGRADPDPARRAVGVPAQGAAARRCARPVDRVPDLAVQGGGGRAQRGPRLHPRDRQGRAGGRRLRRGEPAHRRAHGGGGERLRAEGDAPQPDRGGRDGPGAPPPPVRRHRRGRKRRRRRSVPADLGGQPGFARRRGRAPGDGRDLSGELPAAPRGAGDPDRQDRYARQLPARARHVAAARAHHRPSLGDEARGRDRDPPAPHRPGARADPAGDRHPPRPDQLRAGDRQRRRRRRERRRERGQRRWRGRERERRWRPRREGKREGRRGANESPGRGDRRRTPPRPPSLRGLRRPHRPAAHPRLQRSPQGPGAGPASLLDPRPRDRRRLHRGGPQEVHRRVRLPRRPAGRSDALSGRSEPPPDHPAGGALRGCGGGEGRAERPHPPDIPRQDLRCRALPRRAVRRPRRGRRRPPEAGRAVLRRGGHRKHRRTGSRDRRADLLPQGGRRLRAAGAPQPPGVRGRRRGPDGRHAAEDLPPAGPAGAEEARAAGRAGRAPAGPGTRAGGAVGAGARDRDPAMLPPRLLSVPQPGRRERRRPGALGARHAVHFGPAGGRPAAGGAGAPRPAKAPGRRGRAGLAGLRARPDAAQEGTDHHPGAA